MLFRSGIGEKLASRMLVKFGSPNKTLNASLAELAKVEGLSEIRAKKIKQILEEKSKSYKESNQKTLDI